MRLEFVCDGCGSCEVFDIRGFDMKGAMFVRRFKIWVECSKCCKVFKELVVV